MNARPCVECHRDFTPEPRPGHPWARCPDCRQNPERASWPPVLAPVVSERSEGRQRAIQTAMQRLLAEAEATEWMRDGNCIGVDPDLFFPERGASTSQAKAVCRGCRVRPECLDYALATNEKFGIWGGLSERERRRIRRQRALDRRRGAA